MWPLGVPEEGGERKPLYDGMLTVNLVLWSFDALLVIGGVPGARTPWGEASILVRESFKRRSSSTFGLSSLDFSISSCNFGCNSLALFMTSE